MHKMTQYFRNIIEKSAFGICSQIGDVIGLKPSRVRLYFIYTSFLTFGSPVILYVIAVFWINIKNNLAKRNEVLWD